MKIERKTSALILRSVQMMIEPQPFERNGVPFELRFEREGAYKWGVLVFRQGVSTGGRMSLISGPVDEAGAEMEAEMLRDYLIAAGLLMVDGTP